MPKKLTLLAMAEKVLRQSGKPLHSAEIINIAIKNGWLGSRGKTPHRSLQAVIWEDIKKHGSKSAFKMVGEERRHRKYALR